MALDPDNIRVDLLRIKRKLYLSFPEGSKERQDFIFASKLSELSYLSKLVSPDVIGALYDEHSKVQKFELLNIFTCLGIGACLMLMMLGFHQSHPHNLFLKGYYIPMVVGAVIALTHVFHALDEWRKFKPVRQEYEVLRKKIEKLTDELKGLAQ